MKKSNTAKDYLKMLSEEIQKPLVYLDTDDIHYIKQDINSMYPNFTRGDNSYVVIIDEQTSLIVADVVKITFKDGSLNFYNSSGVHVAHFQRDQYRYFYKIGL